LQSNSDPRAEIQIGGQAVIEGVVMRGPEKWALAVRRPSGDMFVSVNPTTTLAQRYPGWNRFPVRGIFALADSLVIGIKSLFISGAISLEEAPEAPLRAGVDKAESNAGAAVAAQPPQAQVGKSGLEADLDAEATRDLPEDKHQTMSTAAMAFAMLMALALFLGLFIVLPAVIAKSLDRYLTSTIFYNLVEGGIRVAVFIGYLAVMSFLPDIRRVFMYHGAEHKVVHTYEAGQPLTPESATRFSTAHMRCGTAFIMIVLILSVLVFSLMGRPALWLRIVERLAIIPLVAAFSYEIIRFAGRYEDSTIMKIIMAPGLLLQKLTTKEPDESQLEVAIVALKAAVGKDDALPSEA
jgi:uncharacterized protein YqhQ